METQIRVRLVGSFGQFPASLSRQLFGHGPDVVRLEPAAAPDVADAEVVGSAGKAGGLPTGYLAGLSGYRFTTIALFE